jgi:hypothetical protein
MIILKSGYNTDGALVYWLRLARRTKVLLGCLLQPGLINRSSGRAKTLANPDTPRYRSGRAHGNSLNRRAVMLNLQENNLQNYQYIKTKINEFKFTKFTETCPP